MSWNPALDHECTNNAAVDALGAVIVHPGRNPGCSDPRIDSFADNWKIITRQSV